MIKKSITHKVKITIIDNDAIGLTRFHVTAIIHLYKKGENFGVDFIELEGDQLTGEQLHVIHTIAEGNIHYILQKCWFKKITLNMLDLI